VRSGGVEEDAEIWVDCFCGWHGSLSGRQRKRTGHMESYLFSTTQQFLTQTIKGQKGKG